MVKNLVIFAVSLGLLIVIIMPAPKEDAATEQLAAVTPPPPPKVEKPAYWGDANDKGSSDAKPFVFGEPMTNTNPVGYAVSQAKAEPANPATGGTQLQRIELANSVAASGTPAPGQPGSKENPINTAPSGAR